jgi:hypothetical protein
MGAPLTTYARRFVVDRATFQATLEHPMLVWSSGHVPSTEAGTPEHYLPTDAGRSPTRPSAGMAIAFEVKKVIGKANPFAMGITVGRLDHNDVVVDDATISRFHAYFQKDEKKGSWSLSDAESKHGSFVNGLQLQANQRVPLTNGCDVRFGVVAMQFFTPEGFITYLDELANGRF